MLEAREKLLEYQLQFLSNPSDRLIQLEHEQSLLFSELSNVEESFLRQKSMIKWLNEGDQNTNFSINMFKLSMLEKKLPL